VIVVDDHQVLRRVARALEAPVLCKGNDFRLTDIAIA